MKGHAIKDSEPGQPAELRRRAEEHLRASEPDRAEVTSVADARALVHELQVHQIELEMQNEELRRARIEAEEAKEKYLDLFDFAPAGHFLWDRDGRILELNLAGAALLGLERSVASGKRFGQFVAAEFRRVFAELLVRVLTTDAKQTCEVVMEREGSSVWALVEGIAAQDRLGAERLCRATVIDISAQKRSDELAAANEALEAEMAVRKRAEGEVRRAKELSEAVTRVSQLLYSALESEEIIRRIVVEGAAALGSDSGAISEREGRGWRILYAHRMPEGVTGLRLEDEQERHAVLALETRDVVPVEDGFNDERFNREHLRRYKVRSVLVAPMIIRGAPFGVIFFNYHQRKHAFTESELNFGRQLGASAAGALENARLFEERKRAEEALRISQERLNQAVAVAGLGTFQHDHASGAVEYSPVLRELMGFDPEEKVTLAAIIEKVLPEDREAMVEAVRRAHDPAGEGGFAVDHRVRKADGRVRWISVRAQTFFEGEGSGRRAVRTIGAGLDITEQKEFQAELQRLVDERTARLQELVGELEHFSYTITHDLKSPLRAMRGFAEMMSLTCAECDRTQEKEFLGRIAIAAERMDHLIADALNYSRLVRQELPLEDVDAWALLRGMLDSYPELQPGKARIVVEGQLPVLLANQSGLTQCFSNLLGNAVKFVKPGVKADVRVWAELAQAEKSEPDLPNRKAESAKAAPGSGWVRIWVEDKGIGISRELLPRVFDMFSRGSRDYEGTGIGLALVRKVVQRMGGKVGVESEEGKGSRFWIELKCGEAKLAFSSSTARQGGREESGTVLYVEDEESDAMFMQRAFERKGLAGKLQLVGDGRAAIDYLSGAGKYGDRERYPVPTLVLLDLNLPQVGGFEVLRWMRNNPDYARTPVVVFSSSTREDDRVRAKELGADAFVAKPSSGLKFGEVAEELQRRWLGQVGRAA